MFFQSIHGICNLLLQLDSLKEDGPIKQTKPLAEHEELVKAEDNEKRGEGSTAMGKAEEIIKELRKVSGKNTITQQRLLKQYIYVYMFGWVKHISQ